MGSQPGTGNPLIAFLPLIILSIPAIIVCYKLAKEKGKNVVLYVIWGIIPFVNMYAAIYLAGTVSKQYQEKVDKLLNKIENM